LSSMIAFGSYLGFNYKLEGKATGDGGESPASRSALHQKTELTGS